MSSRFLMFTTVLALLVPALALVSSIGGPVILYLLALLGMGAMVLTVRQAREPLDFAALTPLACALGAPFVAMLIAGSINGVWSTSEFEKLLRFVLAIPVAWLLLRGKRVWLQQVQWAFLFGAYAGSLMLIGITLYSEAGRMAMSAYGGRYNAVAFADLTLLFGFASTMTLPWTNTLWPRVVRVLKLAASPLAIYAVWVSETRSSWVLFAVLGVVVLLGNRHWSRRLKLAFVGGVAVCLLAAGALAWNSGNSRIINLWTDFQSYQQQDRDTSTGIRMQLWHASWLMFKQEPLTGVGMPNFRAELGKLEQQGVVTPYVAEAFGEPHNDFLAAAAGYGIIGLIGALMLYFVPAWVFLRRLSNPDRVVQSSACIGLLFTLGYAAFSLTEMMFRNMRSVPIYAVTLAILYALTTMRGEQMPSGARR